MAEAWGDVPVHELPIDLGNGRKFEFNSAATPDGTWLIGTSVLSHLDNGEMKQVHSDAVLVRVSDGAVRRMAPLQAPTSQMYTSSSDGRWVVWMEGGTMGLPGPLPRVMAFDRTTGRVRELAHAVDRTDSHGRSAGTSIGYPTLSNGLVVWDEATGRFNPNHPVAHSVIREADLRSGKVRTLAEHARLPHLSWPWVSWETEDDAGGFTQMTNLETGQQSRLDADSPGLFLALHGDLAAYSTADQAVFQGYNTLCLIDDLADAGSSRVALSDPYADFEWITLNDRAIAFSNQPQDDFIADAPTQVYDLVLDTLVDLPMPVGHSDTIAAGPLVVWHVPSPNSDSPITSLRIVDTRDIGQ